MRLLLKRKTHPLSAMDQQLIDCAGNGNLEEVRNLLGAGANVNAQNNQGYTALWIASCKGHLEVVKELLQHDKVVVNLLAKDGTTALVAARCQGRLDIVRILEDHAAPVLTFDEMRHQLTRCLRQCFCCPRIAVFPKRLAESMRLRFLKKNENTLNDQQLIYNAEHGNLRGVRTLLRAGANVNAQQNDGATALYMANKNGHVEIVNALLTNNKVDVTLQDIHGVTALWMASSMGHVEIIKVLLTNDKVDVNL